LDRDQDDSADFEIPEEELEAAGIPTEAGIDAADPESRPAPEAFDVVYIRDGRARNWSATTKRRTGYRPVKAGGVTGYSSATWEGESDESESIAMVSVLVDPRPEVKRRSVVEDVRRLADDVFKKKHPEAVIRHGG
jgi:hypothetical protein